MKILAVDYGTKRLGIAIGAEGQQSFSKMIAISSPKEAIESLSKIIKEEEINTLVFGLPLRLDGTEKEEAQNVRRFAARLASGKLPAVFIDERLSSEEAQSLLREGGMVEKEMRGKIDRKVAELLLAQYYRERGTSTQIRKDE